MEPRNHRDQMKHSAQIEHFLNAEGANAHLLYRPGGR
jgi:hypothetical protein